VTKAGGTLADLSGIVEDNTDGVAVTGTNSANAMA